MTSTSSLAGYGGSPFFTASIPPSSAANVGRTELDEERSYPRYAYMNYVVHGACHWLVNFALRLATLVEPDREWRIITSEYHSTVWDGRDTLFEFNWQAFGELPEECFRAAYHVELPLGKYMDADFVPHNAKDMRRRKSSATKVHAKGPAI